MKTEINNENKAKFFALYWEQKICEMPYRGIITPFECLYYFSDEEVANYSSLALKQLSSISDKDVIELSLFLEKYSNGYKHVEIPTSEIEEFRRELNEILEESNYPLIFCDFLRSKGHAIPWMGLSVEEMVQAGWIKLIE